VIDWFTIAAQIVNFLILIGLLWHFLYKPIARAMDQREQKIASQLKEAERRKADAEEEAEAYRRKREEFEQQHEQLLAQAKEDAAQRRKELTRQARAEVEAKKDEWRRAVEASQKAVLDDFRRRSAEQLCTATRQVLGALANVDLEAQVIDVFTERIRVLDKSDLEALQEAVRESNKPLVVRSAFDIPEDGRQQLHTAVRKQFDGDVAVRFEDSPDLICGIELRAGGHQISWSMDDYLSGVQEDLATLLTSGLSEQSELEQTEAAQETEKA